MLKAIFHSPLAGTNTIPFPAPKSDPGLYLCTSSAGNPDSAATTGKLSPILNGAMFNIILGDSVKNSTSQASPEKGMESDSKWANLKFLKVLKGFGEASPEAKAAKNLHNFFTYTAVKIVAAQLESYNHEAYQELMEFLYKHSLNDGDKFCASMMRESSRHKNLALRIMEVRSAYCKNDFEWDNLKRLAFKMVDESNTRLMRDYVCETSHVESEK